MSRPADGVEITRMDSAAARIFFSDTPLTCLYRLCPPKLPELLRKRAPPSCDDALKGDVSPRSRSM